MTAPDLAPLAERLRALPPSPVRDALLAAVTVEVDATFDGMKTVPIKQLPRQEQEFVPPKRKTKRVPRDTSGWPPGAVAGALYHACKVSEFAPPDGEVWRGLVSILIAISRAWDADPDAAAIRAAAAWAEALGAGVADSSP